MATREGLYEALDRFREALASREITVDRRKIQLPEPIKAIGDHTVTVKLHRDVPAELKVKVVPAE